MAQGVQKTAAKDYPANGIKKGDRYWYAQIKTGPRSSRTLRQLQPFKRSQLTSSDFLSQLYDIEDDLDNVVQDENLPGTLREIAENLRNLGQEQQDKYDNMPEGLQQGPTGEMLEERANNCESWADEIEQAADELEHKIEEINGKEPHDLDDISYDPETDDEEDAPSDEEVQEARDRELTDAYSEAVESATGSNPGF